MKKIIKIYVRFVQKILITILLTLLYFTIFSITKLIMFFFPGKLSKRRVTGNTFWIPAEGYNSDMETATEQS
jgi:hypothetical protein